MTVSRVPPSSLYFSPFETQGVSDPDIGETNEIKAYDRDGDGRLNQDENHAVSIGLMTDLKKNFVAYDTSADGYLEANEIQVALKDKFSKHNIDEVTDHLVVLQAADFITNDIPGKSGYDRYLGLSRDDTKAIEDRLIGYRGDYVSMTGVYNSLRDREFINGFYIPTYNADFEAKVDKLADKLTVFTTDQKFPAKRGYILNAAPASSEDKHVIAREILKLYGNKEALIQEVLDDEKPTFFISDADNGAYAGVTAGEFLWDDAIIGIDRDSVGRGIYSIDFAKYIPGFEPIAHEFSHLIADEGFGVINTDDRYIKIRDELFDHAKETLKHDGAKDKKFGDEYWSQSSVIPGLRNYAFYDKEEFFAVTMELFKKDDEALKELSPGLYDFYMEKLGAPFHNKEPVKLPYIPSGSLVTFD